MPDTELNYAILDSTANRVKIGWTTGNPRSRVASCQTGNPNKLQLLGAWPGTHKDETDTHQWFEKYRCEGEWFRLTKPVIRFLRHKVQVDLDADEDAQKTFISWNSDTPISAIANPPKDHLEILQEGRGEIGSNREVGLIYQLPARGYWPHYARRIANAHQIKSQVIDRISGYKKTGEATMTMYTGYPVWVWLASWLLYAQAKLAFTYEEAWAQLNLSLAQSENQEPNAATASPLAADGAALRCRVVKLEDEIASRDARITELEDEIKSLRDTLRAQQSNLLLANEAARAHLGCDILSSHFPALLAQVRDASRDAKREASRLRGQFDRIKAAIEKVEQS